MTSAVVGYPYAHFSVGMWWGGKPCDMAHWLKWWGCLG